VLRLLLAPEVRATLTAWLKAYGEANDLPGLATGPLEARFHRLREHAGADEMIIWTTPERRAGGGGPHVRIPALHLDLACRFVEGHILAEKVSQVPPGAREPQRERGSVGIAMAVGRVELPPQPEGTRERPDPLAVEIEQTFDRLTSNRWRGFIAPLREALEAEARDDAERAQRLATPYERVEPRPGARGQESPFRLFGLAPSAAAQLEEGEWLDLLNANGLAVATARLVNVDAGNGVLDIDARGADPPRPGTVRPRPRSKIMAQKRAILGELESPRGNLPLLARLMASPAAMPIPRPQFPSRWLNPAVGRSRSQSRAVALALGLAEGEAMLIEGPPGTGKSTTTGEMIAQILARDPHARILVCSHSNHGTDNMLMKVVPYVLGVANGHQKVEGLEPARVGMLERVPADLRRFFVGPDEDLNDRNVIFTTIDALALNDAAGAAVYDYVILDEANRATVLDSLVALARGKRFILVGDRLQLQPVLSEAEEQLRLEPAMARTGVIGKSLFVWLTERHFPDRAVIFLEEQNRMHPMIGGLIARAFYDDRLRNGPAAPRKDTEVPHFPNPAVWVDTRGLRGLRESRGRGPSLFNLPEARLVTTIARHLLKSAPSEMDVGVIAAYAEQVALLRRLLRNEVRQQNGNGPRGPHSGRRLEIDTVDAFEGREKDVIVVSLVRSNRRREIGFLQLMQRINVALSRARRLLIVVGDTATLRGSYFDKILRYLRERGAVTPGPRVIAQLRGQPVRGEGEERRRDRFRGRERMRQERGAPHPAQGAPGTQPQAGWGTGYPSEAVGAGAAPSEDGLPAPLPIEQAAPDLFEELNAEGERREARPPRPPRQRRSPEEILARLNQNIAGPVSAEEAEGGAPPPRGSRQAGTGYPSEATAPAEPPEHTAPTPPRPALGAPGTRLAPVPASGYPAPGTQAATPAEAAPPVSPDDQAVTPSAPARRGRGSRSRRAAAGEAVAESAATAAPTDASAGAPPAAEAVAPDAVAGQAADAAASAEPLAPQRRRGPRRRAGAPPAGVEETAAPPTEPAAPERLALAAPAELHALPSADAPAALPPPANGATSIAAPPHPPGTRHPAPGADEPTSARPRPARRGRVAASAAGDQPLE
jgi:hypothetical protein